MSSLARKPINTTSAPAERSNGSNGRAPRHDISSPRIEVQCNSHAVREATRPRSRCAELTVSLFIGLITHAVTAWIIYNIMVPLIWRQYAFKYKQLLAVLACFALYMACYVFKIGWGAWRWTLQYNALKDTDWYIEWENKYRQRDPQDASRVLDWTMVHHYVIVTNYKEPIEMLKLLAYSLMSQRCEGLCRNQITLVLAMEEREGPDVKYKADELIKELGSFFYEVMATFHPPDLPGDIKGKASNYKWAVQEVEAQIRLAAARNGPIREDHCLIHVADADSLYDPNYFPNVTYYFCISPDRYHLVWQPCMLPTCNLWDLAAPCRQVNMMIAAQEMMSAHDSFEFQIPFSTYGFALKTLQKVAGTGNAADAQDGDVICEDHHLFIKAFFATDAKLRIFPIFLPCLNFAVGGEPQSWCANIKDRFVQAKRHMFGISELIFCIVMLVRGKWCRKGRFGCKGWMRTTFLLFKFLKIHLVPYLGFWVTLGLILAVCLRVHRVYCEEWALEHPSAPQLGCKDGLSQTAETMEAYVFSVITTFTFLGSLFIIVAFVRMLRFTHHTLLNISDPNGAFMDSGVWERCLSSAAGSAMVHQRSGEAIRSFPLIRDDALELSQDAGDDVETPAGALRPQVSHRPRRPMQIGGGVPWLGGMLQLGIEFIVFGFITSVVFGSIPAFLALYKIICTGHRMEYVTAPKPGMGGQQATMETSHSRHESARIPTCSSRQKKKDGVELSLRRNVVG